MAKKDPRLAESERARGRQLRDLAADAVELALSLAPEVADTESAMEAERAVDVPFATTDDAVFARKRVNEALAVAEWAAEVQCWVWRADRHNRAPLTEFGRTNGWELRLEKVV